MAALLSSSAVFGTKMAGPTRAHHTSRAQPVRVACAMDDRQKKAAAAVVAVVAPMIMNAQSAFAGDFITDTVKEMQKAESVQVKAGICDRKACKIYPASDGGLICRVYRPKGTEYKWQGETKINTAGSKFFQVDCDQIIENAEQFAK